MPDFICDFCTSKLDNEVYTPLNSRYDVGVYLCTTCDLAQSRKRSFPNETVRTTSSDADWGNVRHGKSLRFDVINSRFDLEDFVKGDVLDIGSNRGDFSNWASSLPAVRTVTAIEPDDTIIDGYHNSISLLVERFENVNFPADKTFDLIYSCQTLEHADSALQMMQITASLMREDSRLLLDIPNLEVIRKPSAIEEFFIDKHSFHFSYISILSLFDRVGLYVHEEHIDEYNMTFVLGKTQKQKRAKPQTPAFTEQEFELYAENIEANRHKLRLVVEDRIKPLLSRQRCAIWGAGRPLDALIKFGNLEIDENLLIVDGYLNGKILINDQHEIKAPSFLKLKTPDVLFVLANSAEESISEKAYLMGIRHVIKFSEMLEQVE